jgi:hypothetical protein
MIKIENRIVFDGIKESKNLENMPMINDDNYYDDREYITNSMLGKLKEHPATLKEYLNGGKGESTSALSVGDALHKGMLEPEKYESMIKVWSKADWPEPTKTIRTKANKDWLWNFKQEHKDMCVLEDTEYEMVQQMLESLKTKPEAMKWLEDAEYEHIALANINGINMKSKGDIVRNDEWLIDIKTTSDIDLESFKQSCDKYGYKRQGAMYRRMFGRKRFGFLIVEKKFPFKVAFYELSEESLLEGDKELESLIDKFKYYFMNEDFFAEPEKQYVMEGII